MHGMEEAYMSPGEVYLRDMLQRMNMPIRATYIIKECCALLHMSRSTFYRLCDAGELQRLSVRRFVRMRFTSLANFLTRHVHGAEEAE